MTKKLWAGLDVGVETTSICVIDDFGSAVHQATCATNVKSIHREIVFLKRRKAARVGLESGSAMCLARGLRTLGYAVDIYETRQLSAFLRIQRVKTDANDAFGIAQAGRLGAPLVSKVHLKSFECQALTARLRIRKHLVRARFRAVSLLCRQLEQFGGRVCRSTRSAGLRPLVEAEIKTLFGRTSTPLVCELRRLLDHCLHLMEEVKRTDKEMRQLANAIDPCRRFLEIPGVGPICALSFYAAVGEPNRFRRCTDVGSYLGLTPKTHQSGLVSRAGRISKMGNREARSLLVTASTQFMKLSDTETAIHTWARAVELRRGRLKARIALARKLATVMLAMWKTGDHYHPVPASTQI